MRTELISQSNNAQRSSEITILSRCKKVIIASALALAGLLIWQFVRHDAPPPLVVSKHLKTKEPVAGT